MVIVVVGGRVEVLGEWLILLTRNEVLAREFLGYRQAEYVEIGFIFGFLCRPPGGCVSVAL